MSRRQSHIKMFDFIAHNVESKMYHNLRLAFPSLFRLVSEVSWFVIFRPSTCVYICMIACMEVTTRHTDWLGFICRKDPRLQHKTNNIPLVYISMALYLWHKLWRLSPNSLLLALECWLICVHLIYLCAGLFALHDKCKKNTWVYCGICQDPIEEANCHGGLEDIWRLNMRILLLGKLALCISITKKWIILFSFYLNWFIHCKHLVTYLKFTFDLNRKISK